MDIQTFKRIVHGLPANISVLVRGRHGIGKTEIIRQVSSSLKKPLPVLERRISQLTEGDLVGLGHKVERTDKDNNKFPYATKFLPLEWFVEATETPFLIFLDEFDRAVGEVRQAVFELVLDRSIQGNKIHEDCRIYAAVNGGEFESLYQVEQLDPALLDRFWVCDLSPSVEEWLEWAQVDNNIMPEIISFIDNNKHALEEFDKDFKETKDFRAKGPSRRSWKRLNDSILSSDDLRGYLKEVSNNKKQHQLFDVLQGLCNGFVGADSSSLFIEYLTDKNKFIDVTEVLHKFDDNKDLLEALRLDEHNFLIGKIYDYFVGRPNMENEEIENIFKYMLILPKELALSIFDKLSTMQDGPSLADRNKLVTKSNKFIRSIIG